jgi:hypothetical protein
MKPLFFANFIDDQSSINPLKPEKLNPMKTDQLPDPTRTVFLQTVGVAVSQLKHQLQHDYEQAYPELREIIHLVLDEEESRARALTVFPHLLLPDLVEAHVSRLNLRPVETKHEDLFAPHRNREIDFYQPALALAR